MRCGMYIWACGVFVPVITGRLQTVLRNLSCFTSTVFFELPCLLVLVLLMALRHVSDVRTIIWFWSLAVRVSLCRKRLRREKKSTGHKISPLANAILVLAGTLNSMCVWEKCTWANTLNLDGVRVNHVCLFCACEVPWHVVCQCKVPVRFACPLSFPSHVMHFGSLGKREALCTLYTPVRINKHSAPKQTNNGLYRYFLHKNCISSVSSRANGYAKSYNIKKQPEKQRTQRGRLNGEPGPITVSLD